jgi:hypothetical protein
MERLVPQGDVSAIVPQYTMLSSPSTFLSEELLDTFIREFDRLEVVGISIGGSHVRGEATPYSDVDLLCFYSDVIVPPPKRYLFRQGRLIGVASRTVAGVRRDFTQPETALYAVPMIREMSILIDKNGMLQQLQQEALAFHWEQVRYRANAHVNALILHCTEAVYKMLGILFRGDELAFVSAMTTFPMHLTQAVVLHQGVLITTDHSYYQQVREAVGLTSLWTQAHVRAVSVEPGPAHILPLLWRGGVFLALYHETARLLLPSMISPDREVVEQTLRIIAASGLVLPE